MKEDYSISDFSTQHYPMPVSARKLGQVPGGRNMPHWSKIELTMLVPQQATFIVCSDHPLDEQEQKEAMQKAYGSTTGYEFKYQGYSGIEGEHTWQGEVSYQDVTEKYRNAKILWLDGTDKMPATLEEK
jgi:hypothetical protein